ncbi:Protein BONZAI 3 [Bienertia sinuspersici]
MCGIVLQLSLSASDLLDLDIVSKSDPMAVVYMKKLGGTLEEIGRTEVILNSLNPAWIGKIPVVYHFEMVQPLVGVGGVGLVFYFLKLFSALKLQDQDFIGEASCVLSEILTKRDKTLTLKLHKNKKNAGTLSVHAEETVESRNAAEIVFRCTHLDNKDLLSKSDPFLRISRKVETGDAVPICKTEVVDNNLNPVWKPVHLTTQHFVSKANAFREKQLYSFLDYISSGFELNFMVAIDFTASNGNPRSPESLHYINQSGRLNAYQQAIKEVGEVIQFYDSDKRFSAWGFGGRTADNIVSHCFNLNAMPYDSEVIWVN